MGRNGAAGRLLLLFGVLLVVTLVAYHPAWHGGLLWDDDAHLTRSDLRSVHGLWRIWFEVGATQQYYPLVHSAFWVMRRLWGDSPLGYHLANIVLHASSAFLIAVILRRLAVPGAALAALIFAVHPVEVESVAWIAELKNALSGVCYLGAALAYLHFDTGRKTRAYVLALALFVLALLSKTVTATLPAALLVVFWWQRGRLRWREDVVPLVPLLALGIGAGILTAWVERTQIGAEGPSFQFTLVERCLIAGRAIWFYLGKLVWPANLIFIYPRWQISQAVWWQYLYPLAVAGLLVGLWFWRARSRAPLAAMLFFIGTLFPALGFFNVYPFLYSFVADHFQYLASIGIIALFSAGVVRLARQTPLRPALATTLVALVVGGPLTALAWNQSGQYADAETLYRETLRRNPACWLARNNLGWLMFEDVRICPNEPRREEAVAQFREALRLRPGFAEAHNNLGTALLERGRFDEAEAEYREAFRLKPNDSGTRDNLALLQQKRGDALQTAGRLEEAVTAYRNALRLSPNNAETHHNLGSALGTLGRLDDAVAEYQETLRLNPSSARAGRNLALALLRLGRLDEAASRLRDAVKLAPDPALANAFNELGIRLAESGRYADAVTAFRDALQLRPDFADARANLEKALSMIKIAADILAPVGVPR